MAIKVTATIEAVGGEIDFHFDIEDANKTDDMEAIIAQRFLSALVEEVNCIAKISGKEKE
ncbi:hypothetical protein [Yokenella regensburgei]|uniref:hypothetical protein n=1 Tax=Yokenella regensburgei TaxID=158877 RepID=UPI001375946F|nr:hypothetical protein [Yokenella regensburgei]KAF1370874.1 hypothetical protein FHR25_000001 [Yokenella regensburgei]